VVHRESSLKKIFKIRMIKYILIEIIMYLTLNWLKQWKISM